jgi:catechol 2,3-dioxygenase-like lactoylglutathione lyase family enzyme
MFAPDNIFSKIVSASKHWESTMAIKITRLLHAGIRVAPDEASVAHAEKFYRDVLGLSADRARPDIPGIPGFWFNIGNSTAEMQVHVMGAEGKSPVARSDQHDPARPHLALAVEDLGEAKNELERRGIKYWIFGGLVGSASEQVFFEDGAGNVIELQQETN